MQMLQRNGPLPPKQDHTDQLFRLIVDSATDYAIFVLGRDGRIASWNAGAGRLFGYEADEILGRDIAVLFTPEDRANGEPEAERARAERDGRALDDRWHLRKDGSRFFVSGSVSPLRDDAGAFTGFAKVCRDVTERERAKAELQKSRGRLGVALAAAGVGTWLWEVESDRDTLDENMCRMLGLPPEEREMPWEDFLAMVHPEDRGDVDEHIRDCLVHGRDFEFEFRVVRPDGIRWFRDLGKVLSGDDGKSAYVAGACLDITDRKRDEDALKDADRRKDEFLAMLAHELRNPLAAISGALQIAFRPGMEEHQAWVSEVIERQVRHLVRLVDDLLDVSRITRGKVELKRELVQLATHIHRAVEAVRPLIEDRRHELTVSLAPTPMALEADPVRLEQILVNLLTNAAKYTEPGGHIAVSATREGGRL